jgi:ABC-type sugar transport system ATPase subunit
VKSRFQSVDTLERLFLRMDFLEVLAIRKETVLPGISLQQRRFQKLAITGESGSGKSTLLKVIAGYLQPDGGEVRFEGKRVRGPEEKLVMGHPGIAYLSQHFELWNNYRVEEILSYNNQLTDQEASALFEICRIDTLLQRKTDQVSGGERQRIALAKLLLTSPRLLLLDEPFSNLDLIHKGVLKSVIDDIAERLQITCLLVSHDPTDTLPWADWVIVMREGRIIQQGSPETVYRQPVDEYTAGIFGPYSLLEISGGKTILVRPEDLYIPEKADTAPVWEGRVEKVRFMGSAYELQVLVGRQLLLVRQKTTQVQPGDSIRISLTPGPH